MWQFRQAIAGMRDACLALGIAVVSGNVSFYNETEGRAIPPTPTVASVGILRDVTWHVTQWFKNPGDVIVLLGETQNELGASEYLATVHGMIAGAPPYFLPPTMLPRVEWRLRLPRRVLRDRKALLAHRSPFQGTSGPMSRYLARVSRGRSCLFLLTNFHDWSNWRIRNKCRTLS
jgi:hypothetical protein